MRANILCILMAAGVLAACSDSTEPGTMTLPEGMSRTPITVQTNIAVAPQSRAYDKTFENGDQLFAYIEAGREDAGVFTADSPFKWADNFTMGEEVDNGGAPGVGNITTSTALSPVLYWDDFSSTTYDLRDANRGIRLKYGYCYNGGYEDNASGFVQDAGTLTWTIKTDQSAEEDMKKTDLLYAKTQDMIHYGHAEADRGILTLPYTHAMSKVTINVTTGEGYDASTANFATSVLTLKNIQTKAAVNAPAAEVTVPAVSIADVTTFIKEKENTTATYQAIIAPTTLSVGNVLATITNIDGDNNYNIPLTAAILDAWKAEDKLAVGEEVIYNGEAQAKPMGIGANDIPAGVGYITKPGIHYILDVTVDKQKITIRATITDWDSVRADGIAAINFTDDITTTGSIANELKANGFDVYKSSTNSSFPTVTTTITNVAGNWKYSPVIYWAGQGDASYFRAVSPAGASASELIQGIDLMWGTSGDEAIAPRTGDVGLDFQHLMSKLCINLETTTGASAVNLADAKIKITNLATTGTYSIVNGSVAAGSPASIMLNEKGSGFVEYVVPQTIGDDARVVITLANGTTYSLQLNECVVTGTTTNVGAWTEGKSYTYTITLEKAKATFRALVRNWEDATGSGNATLEWD